VSNLCHKKYFRLLHERLNISGDTVLDGFSPTGKPDIATIENRSRVTVFVKNRAELYREFPFTHLKQAKQYVAVLGKQDCAPTLSQKENAFLIKIVQAGYKPVRVTLHSLQDAEGAIAQVLRVSAHRGQISRGGFRSKTQCLTRRFPSCVSHPVLQAKQAAKFGQSVAGS
jgi:hypothetical protein